jgi:hypothetical protein
MTSRPYAVRLGSCPLCGRERWSLTWQREDSSPVDYALCGKCAPYGAVASPGWLPRSPLWPEVRAFMVVEDHQTAEGELYPRYRLEVEPPIALFGRLQAVRVPCVHCGSATAPFRRRLQERGLRLYYTATCPVRRSVGCSRSHAAHDDHFLVLEALGGRTRESERQSSFGWD